MTNEMDASRRSIAIPPIRGSFVVRVWHEPSADAGAAAAAPVGGSSLRGSVQPVGGGGVRYFASLDHLAEMIRSSLDLPGTAASQTPGDSDA
jgi:hypothetical protein